ncbi:MAG: hypothetical protein ACKV2U_23175 [Bryobacteraceae bacterium]
MSTAARPDARGNIDEPVLPCENLDVEVVSDIVEDYADIEVVAKAEEQPDPDLDVVAKAEEKPEPDLDVVALLEDEHAGQSPAAAGPSNAAQPPAEPGYYVEVAVEVKEEGEPEIEVEAVVTDSPVTQQGASEETIDNSTGAAGASGVSPPPEPDYDIEVECEVIDAGEPDLDVTCTIVGDSNEARGGGVNA